MDSRHGICWTPRKSPYNFERYQSELEHTHMQDLDDDTTVAKWSKMHGIIIPYMNDLGYRKRYLPDFLVQYTDGTLAIHEIKNPKLIDSEEVKLKRRAAELWCKRRGMEYKIVSVRV